MCLVVGTEAIRLCRERGYRQLPAHRAVAHLDTVDRRVMADLRTFAVQARLWAPSMRGAPDRALLASLRTRVRSGLLAVVREGSQEGDSQDSVDVERKRVVRAIERDRPQGLVSQSGRRP